MKADATWLGRRAIARGTSLSGRGWLHYVGTVDAISDDGSLVKIEMWSECVWSWCHGHYRMRYTSAGWAQGHPVQWFKADQVRLITEAK